MPTADSPVPPPPVLLWESGNVRVVRTSREVMREVDVTATGVDYVRSEYVPKIHVEYRIGTDAMGAPQWANSNELLAPELRDLVQALADALVRTVT